MQLFDNVVSTDEVYTPDWCAKDMVEHFRPTGSILEPCKGEGVFLKYLPRGTPWCEIREGVDFFDWLDPVDWIMSNPPYSNFRAWLRHSFKVAENSVYLLPLRNVFNAFGQLQEVRERGWVKHIRIYGTGTVLKFPMGNAMGAIHFMRGYHGDTSWSWYR